jgi:hypothetical protein
MVSAQHYMAPPSCRLSPRRAEACGTVAHYQRKLTSPSLRPRIQRNAQAESLLSGCALGPFKCPCNFSYRRLLPSESFQVAYICSGPFTSLRGACGLFEGGVTTLGIFFRCKVVLWRCAGRGALLMLRGRGKDLARLHLDQLCDLAPIAIECVRGRIAWPR